MSSTSQALIETRCLWLTPLQLDRIREAVYAGDAEAWQSPAALSRHLQLDGAHRRLTVVLWAMFGIGTGPRLPCIDWADLSPLFDACADDEVVAWCALDVDAFATGLTATAEVTRALRALDSSRVTHCVFFHLPGERPFRWDALYDAVDALGAALPKSARCAWTSVTVVDESRLTGCDESIAGLFLRFRAVGTGITGDIL